MNRKMFLAACAAIGAFAITGTALAQDTTTNQSPVIGNVTMANRISVGDQIFLMDLVHANAREIELSRVAERYAASHGVSDYARHMIDDHEALQHQLLGTYGSMGWMHNWQDTLGRQYRAGNAGMAYYNRQDEGMNNDMNNNGTRDWSHPSNWDYLYPSDWNDINKLRNLNGYSFDEQYITMMAADHAMLWTKIAERQNETRNSDIQSLISSVGPTVQHHLDEARMIAFNYQDPFDINRADPWIH